MKINAGEIRVGMLLEYKNDLWQVLKTQHVKPGKGGAFAQVEMKSVNKNTKLNERFRSDVDISLKAFGGNSSVSISSSIEFDIIYFTIGNPRFSRDSRYFFPISFDKSRILFIYRALSVTDIHPLASSKLNVCADFSVYS